MRPRSTTDHAVIRRWVEEHGGRPVAVGGTGAAGEPAPLRIAFDGDGDGGDDGQAGRGARHQDDGEAADEGGDGSDGDDGAETLRPLSWKEFFRQFDARRMAFIYQEGEPSQVGRLVRRERTPRGPRQAG
jgi:hypothetical protein